MNVESRGEFKPGYYMYDFFGSAAGISFVPGSMTGLEGMMKGPAAVKRFDGQ